ncbi:MAG: ATP-binding cassette domain-containing protein [Deltaproteobacteria bacterium]|nr:ATP-binding cassette domain-containing protein [Candidatus Anaeroferrophillacea bacterium]
MSSSVVLPRPGPAPAIRCRRLTKFYRVYPRPVDRLKEVLLRRPCHQRVEALGEVSVSIGAGETWGLIGDNGAGKSTFLKLLAGTVTPSAGELEIHGRVAALLELGSGFHPEFSGRRNIYLNAALLGLTEAEIRRREPEIIAFAELEEMIDRPVKTYSSGMYVRLAFAIATSVDPDILIIDEALAVGDNHFQRKCIARLMEFRRRGKTILFCSHSLYLINELCGLCLWLAGGTVRQAGDAAAVVAAYQSYQDRRALENGGHNGTGAVVAPVGDAGGDAVAVGVAAHKSGTADAAAGVSGEAAVGGSDGNGVGANGGAGAEKTGRTTAPAPDAAPLPRVVIEALELVDGAGRPVKSGRQFAPLRFRWRTRCTGSTYTGHVGFGIMNAEEKYLFTSLTNHEGLEPVRFSGVQEGIIEFPAAVFQGDGFRAALGVFDDHGLLTVDVRYGASFAVVGRRPELGRFWMEHVWRLPEAGRK